MIEEKYLVYLWINLSQLNPVPGKSDSVSFQLHFSPNSFVKRMSRVLQWHFSLNIISPHFIFLLKDPCQTKIQVLIFTMPCLVCTNNCSLWIKDLFYLVMEYFRCNVAQSLSFGLFTCKREINSGNLNLYLPYIGTQMSGCVYIWKQWNIVEIVTGPCIRGQSFRLGLCLTYSVNLSNIPSTPDSQFPYL